MVSKKHYSYHILRNDVKLISKLANKKTLKVLEIGCGTGNLTRVFLSEPGFNVIALDVSRFMLDRLSEKLTSEEKKRVSFVCSDWESWLNNSSEKVDVIACCGALHHIPEYWQLLEQSFPMVLEKGFVYIACEPLHISLRSRGANLIFNVDKMLSAPKNFILFIYSGVVICIKKIFGVKMFSLIRTIYRRLMSISAKQRDEDNEIFDLVEFYSEGLDHSKIIEILAKNKYKILFDATGASSVHRMFHKIMNMFNVRTHFRLVARRKI